MRKEKIAGILVWLALLVGGRAVYAMSDQQEISIGRDVSSEVERRYGVWHDAKWDPILQNIGEDLRKHLSRPLPYTFKLVDMKDANAFALPGGFVFVARGLLPYLQSEGELAGVLSHEVSHVELKHFQRMVNRENTFNILSTLAMILTNGAARPIVSVASIMDNFVLEPKYSRGQETEADLNGVKLMVAMGRDPYDMIRLFEEFEKHEKGGGIIPVWMQDHPDFPTRIAAVEQEIAKYSMVPPRGGTARILTGEVLADASGTTSTAMTMNTDASNGLQVQWVGDPTGISQIEFDGKDSAGNIVDGKIAPHLPFSVLLQGAASVSNVDAILTYADGSTAKVTVPVEGTVSK